MRAGAEERKTTLDVASRAWAQAGGNARARLSFTFLLAAPASLLPSRRERERERESRSRALSSFSRDARSSSTQRTTRATHARPRRLRALFPWVARPQLDAWRLQRALPGEPLWEALVACDAAFPEPPEPPARREPARAAGVSRAGASSWRGLHAL